MGCYPASKKTVRFDIVGAQEFAASESDSRLEKRLKRKRIADRGFNQNSHGNTLIVIGNKRARENTEEPVFYESSPNDGDEDPDYMMFLKKLKEDGDSYGVDVFLDNEAELEDDIEDSLDNEDEFDDQYMRFINPAFKKTNGVSYLSVEHEHDHRDDDDDDDDAEEYVRYLNLACGGASEPSNKISEHEHDDDDTEQYVRYLNRACGGATEQSNEISGSKSNHLADLECDQEDESDDICQDYLSFVDRLEIDGEETMYKIDDSPRRLVTDGEESDDSEVVVMDKDPYLGGDLTPFVSCTPSHEVIDADSWSSAEIPGTSSSRFRKGLMEILEKPYDSKQFKTLRDEVSRRRPLSRDREFRGRTRSCTVENSFGKSYLDHFSDFAKQMNLAGNDSRKILYLLRGFFYYITNISLEGAFQPWKDPSCLEGLPQK